MPNYCHHRLYFKASPDVTMASLRESLHNSSFVKLLADGVHAARVLFIRVYTGQIRVTPDCYGIEPLCWLSKYGGARINLNLPIDYDASLLIKKFRGVFDSDLLTQLVAYSVTTNGFDKTPPSPIEEAAWEYALKLLSSSVYDIDKDSRLSSNSIRKRYKKWVKHYEEPSDYIKGLPPEKGIFDAREILPDTVLPYLGNKSNYTSPVRRWNPYNLDIPNIRSTDYGVKWLSFEFEMGRDDEHIYIDFDAPWCSFTEEWWDAFSKAYPSLEDIYYAEANSALASNGTPLWPGLVLWRHDKLELQWVEEKNDYVVITPDWIEGKVGNYGG